MTAATVAPDLEPFDSFYARETPRLAALARSVCGQVAAESRALQRLGRSEDRQVDPDDEIVLSALRPLPRRQAQAMTLRCMYDLPLADIASVLDCSAGTVKVHLSRARAKLASGML